MLFACLIMLATAAPDGQIAFLSGTNQEDLRVAVLDVAAGSVVPVGAGRRDTAPAWSPDGAWIAHATQVEGGMGIRVVRADGGDARLAPHAFPWNTDPRWAQGGGRVAYAAQGAPDAPGGAIMVYDAAAGTETRWGVLAEPPEHLLGFTRPVWLPGLKLMGALRPDQKLAWEGVDFDTLLAEAFSEGVIAAIGLHAGPRGQTTEIYLITRTQAVPLLPFVLSDSARHVEWAVEPAPNGERIAYESNDGGFRSIFMLSRTGIHDVSNHAAADWSPVWSPDSTRIAFESLRGGRRGVYRVYPDTARVTPVAVEEHAECWAPAWSPDGQWIAYVSDLGGAPDLWLCDDDGGRARRLTGGGGVAYAPAWRPAPEGGR